MTTFEHQGIAITLTESGTFNAKIADRFVSKPSLSAMKSYIDKLKKESFAQFTVLVEDYKGDVANNTLKRVTVVGLEKNRSNYGPTLKFRIEKIGSVHGKVLADSPESIAAYEALRAHIEEERRIQEELRSKRHTLERALFVMDANLPAPYLKPRKVEETA